MSTNRRVRPRFIKNAAYPFAGTINSLITVPATGNLRIGSCGDDDIGTLRGGRLASGTAMRCGRSASDAPSVEHTPSPSVNTLVPKRRPFLIEAWALSRFRNVEDVDRFTIAGSSMAQPPPPGRVRPRDSLAWPRLDDTRDAVSQAYGDSVVGQRGEESATQLPYSGPGARAGGGAARGEPAGEHAAVRALLGAFAVLPRHLTGEEPCWPGAVGGDRGFRQCSAALRAGACGAPALGSRQPVLFFTRLSPLVHDSFKALRYPHGDGAHGLN